MSDTAKRFATIFEKARKRIEYFVEGAIIEFTESVVQRMEGLEISKTDLSERLRCKPSYITKVLQGGTNFTLESMVKIAVALDCELAVRLIPKSCETKWSEVFTGNIENRVPNIKSRRLEFPAAPRGQDFIVQSITSHSVTTKEDEFIFCIAA